jgi:hypothetical protein
MSDRWKNLLTPSPGAGNFKNAGLPKRVEIPLGDRYYFVNAKVLAYG